MSTAGLLAVGTVVTLIVATAMGLLVYGLVLERRDEMRWKRAEVPVRPARRESGEPAA